MKIIFTQVNPRYYAVYGEDKKYIQPIGTITWDHYDKLWEFFPDGDGSWFNKEQLNTINTFFQALEDLDDSTD